MKVIFDLTTLLILGLAAHVSGATVYAVFSPRIAKRFGYKQTEANG